MLTNQDWITAKKRIFCLTPLIFVLMIFISVIYWTEVFENQWVIISMLSPQPNNQTLKYVSSLCLSPNIPIKPPSHSNILCTQKPIVTVEEFWRLGNQVYEYISVWAIAKTTGREPYVPSCMIQELGKIFQNLPVSALSYLAYCSVKKYPVSVMAEDVHHSHESISLPDYAQLPRYMHLPVSGSGRGDRNGWSAWLLGLVCSTVVRFVLPAPGVLERLQCCRDEGRFNPVGRHCDRPAVYGDSHRFSCAGQDLVRATVGRFQGARYCILPEEDMGRVCQVLVDKDSRRGVTCRWDWPQLLEVASELGNEIRWIPFVGGDA